MEIKEILVDSSFIFAFISRQDNYHKEAAKLISTNTNPLVITDFCFAELTSLITKRIGKKIAIQIGEKIMASDFMRITYVDEHIKRAAWKLFTKFADKNFDFIDAISFSFCKDNKIDTAFTLDKHFKQIGFKTFPI